MPTSRILDKHYEFKRILIKFLRKSIVMILMIISLSLVYLSSSFSKKISSINMEIIGPFLIGGSAINDFLAGTLFYIPKKIVTMQNMQEQNEILKNELLKLKIDVRSLQLVTSENQYLKKLLNVVDDEKFDNVSTKLISVVNTPFGSTALIGAGKNHGIEPDQIVTNHIGLIGKIVEISNNYAKIMLTGDYNARIPVVTSITGVKGILVKKKDKNVIAYLPDDHAIQVGEEVLTSGDGKIYPSGIFVAKVKKINKDVFVDISNSIAETKFVIVHTKGH